jgi:hypothetical protein
VSKQRIHELRNWVDNGVLLGLAATLSVAIFQARPFSSAARYVAFWIVLPAVWLVAVSFTRVVREFLFACYDGLGTTPRRVFAGGAVGAAFIAYVAIITSNIPARQTNPQTQSVTSLALMP